VTARSAAEEQTNAERNSRYFLAKRNRILLPEVQHAGFMSQSAISRSDDLPAMNVNHEMDRHAQ
jgi:hypothetical protein